MDNDQKKRSDRKGRRSYDPARDVSLAKTLRELGATDKEMAAQFGISRDELASWQSEHPDFWKACQVTAKTHMARIDRALLKLATGFTYQCERPVNCNGILDMVTYDVYVPPSLKAIKLLEGRLVRICSEEYQRGFSNFYLRSEAVD